MHGDSNLHPIDPPGLESFHSLNGDVIPVEVDNGFVTKQNQGVVSRGRSKRVGPPGLLPVHPAESRMVPVAAHRRFLSLARNVLVTRLYSQVLYHFPASLVLSKSPLVVHSFRTTLSNLFSATCQSSASFTFERQHST